MDKWKWLIFGGLAVLTIGILILTKPQTAAFDGDPAKVVAGDHVYGKADSKVVFIEYADFQCPGCGALYQPLKDVKEAYKDKVAFVYRYMPLTSLHPNAKAAAASAEAAGRQGKFWEMHDLLYSNQNSWADVDASSRSSYFEGYAKQLGLNLDQFKKDVASKEVADRIARDYAAAQKAGLEQSTPTVVLNGRLVDNASELSANNIFSSKRMGQLLDAELKKVGDTPPATPVTDSGSDPANATQKSGQ